LLCVPLALSSSFLFPFFAGAVFVAHMILKRSLEKAYRLSFLISLPWMLLLLLHLGLVYDALDGNLLAFFGRVEVRGLKLSQLNADISLLRKSWTEVLGIPLLFLTLVAAWHNVRARARDAAAFAQTVATAAVVLLSMTVLMEWFAVHKYGLQLYLPALAFLGAPPLVRFLRGGVSHAPAPGEDFAGPDAGIPRLGDRGLARKAWAMRTVGVLLVLGCLGLFAHRLRRWAGPNEYEKALARISAEAGAAANGQGTILFLVDKCVMGAQMSLLYYSDMPDHRILPKELFTVRPREFPVFLGTNVNDRIPTICRWFGLQAEDFDTQEIVDEKGKKQGSFFLWIGDSAGDGRRE
ncbi:MAG: hypothetical protein V1918_09920, partial [Planctomycetota bacterium]